MKKIVIIPTYNENENISLMLPQLLELDPNLDILIVDDNSPDGTASIVKDFQKKSTRVHLEVRDKKNGLGRAYIHGFKWALKESYDLIGQMDADFSHRLADLKTIFESSDQGDVIIGSRWIPGGGALKWSKFRKFISLGGSLYSRWILSFPLKDWTGGFNLWKRDVLENIDLDHVTSEGYSFQIEMKYRAQKLGYKVVEVPIVFEERHSGQSKMSTRIVLEALYRVWSIRGL
ncbi:MAG: polyprenol monophosphomannose synthase [Bdellovibrionaceae bacterium]|nr:polyprenol monophosphomannose synthase [Pseudobdellovibrionaceae bacterium]